MGGRPGEETVWGWRAELGERAVGTNQAAAEVLMGGAAFRGEGQERKGCGREGPIRWPGRNGRFP